MYRVALSLLRTLKWAGSLPQPFQAVSIVLIASAPLLCLFSQFQSEEDTVDTESNIISAAVSPTLPMSVAILLFTAATKITLEGCRGACCPEQAPR